MHNTHLNNKATGPSSPVSAEADKPVDSQTLLQGRKTVSIDHHGERYTLRVTASGKLLLTK